MHWLPLFMMALLSFAYVTDPAQRTNAEVLAENLPSAELWSDDRLKAIYAPYLDCYSKSVEGGKGSGLKDDRSVLRLLKSAREQCFGSKHRSNMAGDEYLARLKPALLQSERETVLRHYRRQMGFFALANRYRQQGRVSVLQSYLNRLGKAARQGRSPAVLTAE